MLLSKLLGTVLIARKCRNRPQAHIQGQEQEQECKNLSHARKIQKDPICYLARKQKGLFLVYLYSG